MNYGPELATIRAILGFIMSVGRPSNREYAVYIVRCGDGSLYTGDVAGFVYKVAL